MSPIIFRLPRPESFTRSATAFNAFSQLLLPALRARKIDVRYGAEVLRLEWSPGERRVVAVIYRDAQSGREERLVATHRVAQQPLVGRLLVGLLVEGVQLDVLADHHVARTLGPRAQ